MAGRITADNPDIEAAFQRTLREMTADPSPTPPPQPKTSFEKERVFITYARLVEICHAFYRNPGEAVAILINRSEWR